MRELVIITSGETEWNAKGKLIGWSDEPLTEKGLEQARQAGRILKEKNYYFDLAFTSILRRGIQSLWAVLDEMNLNYLKENKSWRLNERYYGQLEGMTDAEIIEQFGEENWKKWMEDYEFFVPPVPVEDPEHPGNDPRYSDLISEEIPVGESIYETFSRVYPHWDNKILPMINIGRKVLIVAHPGSIKAVMAMIENIDIKDIIKMKLEPGSIIIYKLKNDGTFVEKEVLK